jgi:hypothetical protein
VVAVDVADGDLFDRGDLRLGGSGKAASAVAEVDQYEVGS